MKVLAIAAHPDDEVLGCGATLARLAREGREVYIAILGEGATARAVRPEDADRGEVAGLAAASRVAAGILGAREVFQFGLPDNRFDTVPLLDIVKQVEALVSRLAPRVVFTHWAGDLNVDHGVVHRAVLTATRTLPDASVREVYAFETPSASEWSFGRVAGPFDPNVFVDVSATLDLKLDAMRAYATELRDYPHPRSLEALTALARWRGSMAGVRAAEAFELVRRVW
ncbi:MAG TPA: PIG-L deacetylase family protein [Steroidobacteraceae bacterium]|nr:PIG-L deacetylase family protein [Steroidobacteraceae bacterium]